MVDAQQALARLEAAAHSEELSLLCRKHNILIMTVFGSAVRGRVIPTSESAVPPPRDLDIAVFFDRAAMNRSVVHVVNDVMDLTEFDHIDIMVLNGAGPVAKDQALRFGLPLYESEPGGYARMQMAAAAEFMDTQWLRQADLKLMTEGFVIR